LYVVGIAVVSGTQFMSNVATTHAGGAYFAGAASVTSTEFLSNTTVNGRAGGAYFGGAAVVDDSDFIANRAPNTDNAIPNDGGGAVFLGNVLVRRSHFEHNVAGQGAYGGAIVVESACSSCRIERTSFISNTANDAAGLIARIDSDLWLVNNVFADNYTKYDGVAFIVQGENAPATVHAVHTTIAGTGGKRAIIVGEGGWVDRAFLTNTIVSGVSGRCECDVHRPADRWDVHRRRRGDDDRGGYRIC
jgi:hypothetical protein